jgi:hypothetical protein
MRGGSGKTNQCDPFPVQFSHIAQAAPANPGALEVVPLYEQLVEALALAVL